MSMLDGVSQCWLLSKSCVVNWDAWGVVVALASAVAVAFLGWQTYRVTSATAKLAKDVKERDDAKARREEQILAAHIFPEIVRAAVHYRGLAEELKQPSKLEDIYEIAEGRAILLAAVGDVGLDVVSESVPRLSSLSIGIASAVTQAIGHVTVAKDIAQRFQSYLPKDHDRVRFNIIVRSVENAAEAFERAQIAIRGDTIGVA
ncbi:MAG: hypothetical protein J0H05_05115 [Stenotrophomonas acidaminiphila]|uniref:hypothetical protein n=1 Tax=Stenotrophomonas acidaminiphila TaxID=128780 RepID=UPI0015FCC194|nr:hypothetical protein [Stenotrophomonas acidaminiphila]MBN8801034.1 hypothetical protein [Stenotrophomonas acidaminiphila]MDF9441189.1 hypothetical protein [Stenotrophomonas acidaminiphila]